MLAVSSFELSFGESIIILRGVVNLNVSLIHNGLSAAQEQFQISRMSEGEITDTVEGRELRLAPRRIASISAHDMTAQVDRRHSNERQASQ